MKRTTMVVLPEVEQPSKANILDTKPRKLFLAKVNLAIASVFIVCHSVQWIPLFYEIFVGVAGLEEHSLKNWPPWALMSRDVSLLLVIIASSMNCYIYYRIPVSLFSKLLSCREIY